MDFDVISIKIALAQINTSVGDLSANYQKITAFCKQAVNLKADLLIVPELALCGYPIEDILLSPSFQQQITYYRQLLLEFSKSTDVALLIGLPVIDTGKIYNAACLMHKGSVIVENYKSELPNYQVFDEKRIFSQGQLPRLAYVKGVPCGIMICEEMWLPDAAKHLQNQGAQLLLAINASPYDAGLQLPAISAEQIPDKITWRHQIAQKRIQETGLPLIYLNQVGAQDDLIFDGSSFIMDAGGNVLWQGQSFVEELALVEYVVESSKFVIKSPVLLPKMEHALTISGQKIQNNFILNSNLDLQALYQAIMLGLSDYLTKNNLNNVVIGLSGGIDSALTAAIAVDALGADRVVVVMMPSPYTAQQSLDDAYAIAKLLGIKLHHIPINGLMQQYQESLAPIFQGYKNDTTEENIQSRIRGALLMAISNKFSPLVLNTGNKSEIAVGYSTLYGDSCGAYAPLKDIYKTTVFALSQWRNVIVPPNGKGPKGIVIPEQVIQRPPTAELRPNQKDEDSLPPYITLDRILQGLIEEDVTKKMLAHAGFSSDLVQKIWLMVCRAEYKRRQNPPGPRVSPKAFARERRYPITHGWLKRE